MSIIELARINPVSAPIVNIFRNPIDQRNVGVKLIFDLLMVKIHLKILIPLEIAVIVVVVIK